MSLFESVKVGDLLTLPSKAAGAGTLTAGGAGDNTKVTGQTVDRLAADGVHLHRSVKLAITGKAALAAAATLAVAVEYQDSADGSNWNTAVPMQTSTVEATGGGGGTTEYPCFALDLQLGALGRYVRFNVTPDLSAANTDTASWSACAILGGASLLPPLS